MSRMLLAVAVGVVLRAFFPSAPADDCPPTAQLAGEADLVGDVASVLVERGISTDATGCAAVTVTLQRRVARVVVALITNGNRAMAREVTDTRTAATVIESWVRTDVEAPLLATPAIAARAGGAARPPPATVVATAAPAPATLSPPTRGVQIFTVAETARASAGTSWVGFQLGACVMVGPLCASARARFAAVVGGPAPWADRVERHGAAVLLGADLPLRWGATLISPGVAAGIGWTHTHDRSSPVEGETGGLRADARVALATPISARLALEVALSLEVTQATHVESMSPARLPDEPRLLGRLGAGVRFGGL